MTMYITVNSKALIAIRLVYFEVVFSTVLIFIGSYTCGLGRPTKLIVIGIDNIQDIKY